MMDDGIPMSSSDSAMASKENKYFHDKFKFQMKMHCSSLKDHDDTLFKDR